VSFADGSTFDLKVNGEFIRGANASKEQQQQEYRMIYQESQQYLIARISSVSFVPCNATRFEWQASVASGIYFYRIEAASASDPNNRFVQVKKMLLLKQPSHRYTIARCAPASGFFILDSSLASTYIRVCNTTDSGANGLNFLIRFLMMGFLCFVSLAFVAEAYLSAIFLAELRFVRTHELILA
jgi:hypothetical protein